MKYFILVILAASTLPVIVYFTTKKFLEWVDKWKIWK